MTPGRDQLTKQDIGTPPIQPVSHSSWWKWQKHGREGWSINSQTRRSQGWSIFYTLLPYIQLDGTEHWWLHDCKIENEGEFKWKWERDDDQPRFQCNPVLPHDPSHFLFSCFSSQFSFHPLQSNRAQRPDAVRSHETGLFEIITNPDLRSHPVPLTCRAPSCMSHLNRPLAGYRHCCRCFLCHRFDTFDPTPVWLWCHVTR